jgi:hypothetical protein
VQYLDIGLNIDASIEDSADGVRLNTQVEQSSIAEEKSLARRSDRAASQTGRHVNPDRRRALILGSMDIPGTARRLDIEVLMEHLAQ